MRIVPDPRDPRLPFYSDRNTCDVCKEFFNSVHAFDKHRIGKAGARRCLSADEMRAKGFAVNATGHWITEPRRDNRAGATACSAGDAIGVEPYLPTGDTGAAS
jgi:hypothetical protein